ncbi:HD-GYP domain-containing protein (c-di-GMP phosphodiesterase class II) [Desulfitispora alkaliphila]|uniref:HD domain-containing phosphohydrolase n=1 Tax=Desulfitispora alkaliphila TaxID=622674 RepID=UPI003D256645
MNIPEQLENFFSIGLALSAEKDKNKLLEMILTEARRITNADAGTLYLVEEDYLKIKIIQNQSMNTFKGGNGEEVTLPPVPMELDYVSGYTTLTGKTVNIPDVYHAKDFDFSGPRKYDEMTGYRTKSMLVIPLKNHLSEVIGALQLINSVDSSGNVVPFSPDLQPIVEYLSSLAAITLTNVQLTKDIENLFESFVQVMVTAIDAQTPYNATHTQKVSKLAGLIAEEINSCDTGVLADERFDKDRLYQLTMAGWLHDIGKIATPLEVMNKPTRLGNQLPIVLGRLELAIERTKSSSLEKQLELWKQGMTEAATTEEKRCQEEVAHLEVAKELVTKANKPSTFVDPELRGKLEELAPYLTEAELSSLCIPKGTLTEEERKIMENHVVTSEKMLAKIPFTKKLAQVPKLACMHHEQLNGQGYPHQLNESEIPLEARILAIADIFDALTASDRPYKKGMPVEKALEIMGYMVEERKLDSDLVELFKKRKVWEKG